ncbi:MAG: SusC/RagA family TonB-linked outer membrane protein, partial [Paludibacter sp.]
LITTKRGKSGKPTINLESIYGIQSLAHPISVLNKAQYKEYYDAMGIYQPKTANYNDFNDPTLFSSLPDFNWQNEIFSNAPTSNLQLSVSGGSENSVFMISAGTSKQNGMVSGSDFSRTNFRINSDHTINKWLKFGESLNLSSSIRHRVMEGGVGFNFVSASPIIAALVSDPTTTAYDANGELNYMRHSGSFNGAGIRDRANYTYNNKKISGNIYFEVSLMKELKFKSNLGLDYNLGETKEFLPSFGVAGSPLNEAQLVPSLKRDDSHATYFVIENTLTYNKVFGKQTLGLMVGQTAEMNDSYNLGGFNSSISGNQDYLQYLTAGNPSDPIRSIYGGASAWRMFSYLARLNYAFNDKYLFTGSVRRDASSRFGPLKRAGVFPAVSFGWKIKNEAFLKDIDWLYMAKIRTGWGKVGNQNNIGNYSYNTVIQPNANYILGDSKISIPGVTAGVNGGGYSGTNGGKPGNKMLGWEETNTTSIGTDLSFFENRWSFTTEYFYKDNIGMLTQATVPDYLGIQGPDINGGKISNNGFEIELGHRKLEGDFTYDLNFNLTYIKTKVLELDKPNLTNWIEGSALSRTLVGGGIADFWGLKTNGTFKDAADVARGPVQTVGGNVGGTKPGDMKFVDMNGDGKIDTNDETVIGSPMPDFTYGFTANFYFKSFDLNLFFSGVQGNEIYNNLYRVMMGRWGVNHSTDILNAWTPTNKNTNIPRFEESSLNNNIRVLTDRWIEDGSYLRFKTLSLGYTLPKKTATKLSLQNLRVYATVQNLFTFTKYKGFDPEISQSVGWGSDALDMGVDNGNYPQPRTIIFGINVSL